MGFADFISFANRFGLPWAFLVAVSVAYWLEIQDRKKNSVPLSLYSATVKRVDDLFDGQATTATALYSLVELVKLALVKAGGS
jgi:hypothetical protein